MKKAFPFVLIVIMLFGLVACAEPVLSEVLQSDKQRVTSPVATQAGLATLVDGNSAFAFNLYQALRETDDNLFYSPYSISLALAMTYAGARDETEEQMADTLHFDLPQNRLHPAFNSLDLELGRRGQGAKGKDGEGFRLHIVNATKSIVLSQKGIFFTQSQGYCLWVGTTVNQNLLISFLNKYSIALTTILAS